MTQLLSIMILMDLIIIFIIGLSVGSFVNVLIDRIPRDESIISGRSHCETCRKVLKWKDLIPVLSYMILRGKCRYCKKGLSWQYPLVELLTGCLFIFVFLQTPQLNIFHSQIQSGIFYSVVSALLLAIFFSDLKYRIIPDQLLVFLVAVTMMAEIIFTRSTLPYFLLGSFIFFAVLFFLLVMTKGAGMGFGDVKFAVFIGLILGWPYIIVAFYLAFLTGALLSIILLVSGRKKMKSTIPFGPFLCISAFITLFYGRTLWEILRGMMGI